MAVKLPRLLDSNGAFVRPLHPLDASISEKITPLSTATLELNRGDSIPARSYVEMYTPYGSAGVYRARSPQDAYGDEITTVELEHAIAEVGDYLVKDKLEGMMAPQKAITEIFKHYKGKRWQLGTITALGTVKIAVQENYTRVLDAMLSVLAQKPGCMLTFDFATNPWTVAIKNRDTAVSAEGRLSRNVSSATVTYDDSELCTRAYYETFSKNKAGETVGKWNHKDADTIKTYGTVEREVPISSDLTDDEVTKTVDNYLEQHKNPRVSVDIDGLELNQITGESLDKMTIGKLYRLAIPEYSVTVEQNITGIEWSNLYADSIGMRLLLADDEDTIVTFLHDLDAKGGGGGGGGGKKKEEDKWKEYFTRIQQTDYFIGLQANRVDKVNSILEQAGLELNSKGVLIYAKDNVNNILSKINVQRDRINLVVQGTGDKAKIKAGVIVDAINDDPKVSIEGNRINLTANKQFSSIVGDMDVLHKSAIWQDRDHIALISGKFAWSESRQRLRLYDGASFQVAKDGVYSTVGTVNEIDAVDDKVDEIQGSTIWQTRDDITLVAGKFTVDSNGKLHIKNGSGLYIGEGTSSLGVYNEGNLTAGIIVDKINGGTVTINAARIDLSGYVTASQLSTTDAKIDNLTAGRTTATSLKTNLLSASTGFTYQNRTVSVKTVTIDGQPYSLLGV